MKATAGLVLALGLAACSGPNYPTTAPAAGTGPAPNPPALGPAARRSLVPRPQISVRDQCGAAPLQGLVGRPRTEIPVPLNPNLQRVACTRCPVTEDFNPARLNFFFDADTGLIARIRCG
ncbi:MAG: I78 family peptidase inhibitor [Caulobacterales bacterium]|jgi:hypothetical protein